MADNSWTRPQHPPRRLLSEVAGWLGARLHGDASDVVVSGLTLSSRRVRAGDLYAALPGARVHGADFAREAVSAGATAVLTDADGLVRCEGAGVPVLVVERPRAALGGLAARLYDEPASGLTLLGVTGTQGKTTTARLLESALTASGTAAAVVGTIGTRICGRDVPSSLTTPESADLQALFAVMLEQQAQACVMEVSSHALVMGRVDGIVFDAAVFLNLGRDHLDFHGDLESYFAAKAMLFTAERSRAGITNLDDPHGRALLERATVPMTTFSVAGADADWGVEEVRLEARGSRFRVREPGGRRFPAAVPLPGAFNVANALAAVALAGTAGLDPEAVAAGLGRSAGVPGRLERVECGQDFLAVVDYAHKPDALTAAVAALRPLTEGRLILVVGAGGDRDTGKREVMGEIAARDADIVVVTDDNPRSEEPAAIRAAVLRGAMRVEESARARILEIGGRRDAIREAISLARSGDTVLVAGKGHETGQEIGAVIHPFDDRDEVRSALEGR